MSEESKTHRHEHDHAGETAPHGVEPALDAAGQSLTNALRTSFRLLTVVMIILVALFFIRGFFTVQEGAEKVVIERLGVCKMGLVKDRGLNFALFPIDRVIRIPVNDKAMDVNVFWPRPSQQELEAAATKGTQLEDNFPDAEDGKVLTGDMNVMQGRLRVTYRVKGGADATSEDVVKYYLGIREEANEQKLLRGLLQNAVIIAFSNKPVDKVYPTTGVDDDRYEEARKELSAAVQSRMEKMLEDLDLGLEVTSVYVVTIRPPAEVKKAFDSVLTAHQSARTEILNAEQRANKMLVDATGGLSGPALGKLIGERWEAYEKGDMAAVREKDALISALLVDNPQGAVAGIISDAWAYHTTVESEAAADAATIAKLTADKSEAGAASLRVFLEELRLEAIEEVLNHAYEKFLFNPGKQDQSTLELWLNRRPEIRREEVKIESPM